MDLEGFQNTKILSQSICAGANEQNGAYIFGGVSKDMKIIGERIS